MEIDYVPKKLLSQKTFLNSYEQKIGQITIKEVPNFDIFSMAIPNGNETLVTKQINKLLNVKIPGSGQSVICPDLDTRLIRLANDQLFVMHDSKTNPLPFNVMDYVYLTEQSDAWVIIKISGLTVETCLERMCPIDISRDHFKVNQVARTVMEYLSVIIIKVEQDSFLLMSPSSSSLSFLQTIETSAKHILPY